MSSRLLRRVLTAVVLIAALALPLSAQVAAVQRPSAGVAGPAFLEDLADAFRHWLAHLWTGTLEKNGAQIDPNGGTTPAGTAGVGGDNGPIIDPDG